MSKNHLIAVGLSMFFVGGLGPAHAETKGGNADVVATITRLENESIKASLGNPREFIQKNFADDWVGGTSFGKWETKASTLKDTEDPANKVKSMSAHDMKIHSYGDAAIARYTMAYDDMYKGEHRARTVLCTDTWVKQSGAWRQVASHCSQAK